uniref:Predicted protein n=1 Tax=Hordeum vulgare subsp. vulgare TaxID=112509 RepID=F2DTZ1_HORVV|nr:predicted protein [Hordeum vulgare subsp. vulgare]BAK01147.1 predicted protein [Hordeum vulgare subsp. vulgare]
MERGTTRKGPHPSQPQKLWCVATLCTSPASSDVGSPSWRPCPRGGAVETGPRVVAPSPCPRKQLRPQLRRRRRAPAPRAEQTETDDNCFWVTKFFSLQSIKLEPANYKSTVFSNLILGTTIPAIITVVLLAVVVTIYL